MIRIIDNKEVLILCLNEDCHYWDDTLPFCCDKYVLSSEVINCLDSRFKSGFMRVAKP